TAAGSGEDHAASDGASTQEATPDTSGSPSARSRLGMPARARTGKGPSGRTTYNVARLEGDAARTRAPSGGVRSAPERSTRAAAMPPPAPPITTSPPPTS